MRLFLYDRADAFQSNRLQPKVISCFLPMIRRKQEFAYANEIGGIINLDDITHIEAVEKAVGYIPKTISCRYNPGGLFKISNDIMDNPGDAKYGMTTDQIFEAFRITESKRSRRIRYPCISWQAIQ